NLSVCLSSIISYYYSITYTQYKALQVAGFGDVEEHWMILRRSAVFYHAKRFVGIASGAGHDFKEVRSPNVVRAGAGDKNPSRTQHLHGAQVELLVATQSFFQVPLRL